MSDATTDDTVKAFHEAVNMTSRQLEAWLETDESRQVGQFDDARDPESTGHEAGRRLVALLHKGRGAHADDDLAFMRKVTSYVHRHLAQRPSGDVEHSRWRYSLMNWGHDPPMD